MSDPTPKCTRKRPRKRSTMPATASDALEAVHTAAKAGLAAYKALAPHAKKLLKKLKK